MQITNWRDWHQAADEGLTTVVDPMIVRTGHLFMAGPPDDEDTRETLGGLLAHENSALRDFIDHIVLTEKTPVFNYGLSYFRADPKEPSFESDLAQLSEDLGVGLVMVDVAGDAQAAARATAMEDLRRLFASRLEVADHLVDVTLPGFHDLLTEIDGELRGFEYQWHPDLRPLNLPEEHLEAHQKSLGLLYGDRLFAEYAQELSADHAVHTKRFELGMYFAMRGCVSRDVLREPLFLKKLATQVNAGGSGEPVAVQSLIPSFVGYLLSQDLTSADALMASAVELRSDPRVVRLRDVLAEIRAAGDSRRRVPDDVARELSGSSKNLREWVGRRLQKRNRARVARTIVVTVVAAGAGAIGAPSLAIGAAAGLAPDAVTSVYDYLTGGRKDRRYRKFLTQLRREQARWDEQEALVKLWAAS